MLHWTLIGLPLLLFWSLIDPLRAARCGQRRLVVAVVSGLLVVSVYHQLLRWDIYGMTFRMLLLPVFIAILVLSLWLARQQTGLWEWSWLWLVLAAVLVAAGWIFVMPRHPDASAGGVQLNWPLEPGSYAVIQGGKRPFNHHASVTAQRYALDITKITGLLGRRANGLMPTDFAAYHIYGAAVLAPCDGTVLRTHDGHDETPIGEGVTEDVAGNMVALQCDTATVVLAHLQARVQVTKGQAVTRGTILGRVGSTGNSTEPHLHIHAVDRQAEDVNCLLFTCEGLPISFTRRTFARNDMFDVINE